MSNGVQSSHVPQSTLGESMPLNAEGDIQYIDTHKEAIRYQADPPVCNLCKQEITRENFGWMYLEGHPRGQVECIECRGCTMRRASGTPLQLFLQRHGL
jgi:hypothetical protein